MHHAAGVSILTNQMPTDPAPELTVLVPALDEEDTIREVVDRLLALPVRAQVIVIDDGSRDQTAPILASYGDRILVLTNQERQGKGAAIRQGLSRAEGTVTVIQDADLEYRPEEIPMLIEPILAGRADIVYGNRFKNGMHSGMAFANRLVNVLLAWTANRLYHLGITDEATCYKAVRTELLRRMDLQCSRFEFCPEVTAKAGRLGERILEVPISYDPRTKEAGKKIRWTDAPEAFWTLLRYRFWKPSGSVHEAAQQIADR